MTTKPCKCLPVDAPIGTRRNLASHVWWQAETVGFCPLDCHTCGAVMQPGDRMLTLTIMRVDYAGETWRDGETYCQACWERMEAAS